MQNFDLFKFHYCETIIIETIFKLKESIYLNFNLF